MGFWNYLLGWKQLGIAPSDLVLEVGSGGNPLIRSDVLCDKFIFDDMERVVGKHQMPIFADRPFVCGDAERLPFKDDVFDYIVSYHMIEHLLHPDRFLAEAQRVAKKGYVVSPNSHCEKLFGSFRHRWLIDVSSENVLEITSKPDGTPQFGGFFYELYENNPDFRRFWHRSQHLFEARYQWVDTINFTIHDATDHHETNDGWFKKALISLEPGEQSLKSSSRMDDLKRITKQWLRSIASPVYGRRRFDLMSLVACPICRNGIMANDEKTISCSHCSCTYPLINGFMFLLPELASPCN
jgi:SAM-dependent methyltransferase/uncharacterized protein YbaR (Trm112 family)